MARIQKTNKYLYEFTVILVMLNSLGFPGNFTRLFGNAFGTLMDYGCFALELLVMVVSSGSTVMNLKVMNLRKNYRSIYLFVLVVFVQSMVVTRYLDLQLITSIRLSVTILFAMWVSERFDVDRILKMACTAQGLFVGATMLYLLINPGRAFNAISGETAFVGLYGTKNTCASELTFGMALFLVYYRKCLDEHTVPGRLFNIVLVVQVLLMLMCKATGALATLILAAGFLTVFTGSFHEQRRVPLGWMFIGVSIAFLFASLTILPLFSDVLKMIGKDATLTGRVPLWRQIIRVMESRNTFGGSGYGMFWRDRSAVSYVHAGFDRNSFMGTMTAGAHNLLLECWLNIGLVGIGALFIAMLDTMKRIREVDDLAYLFSAAVFVIIMINGFTERVFGSAYNYYILFLFLAMAVAAKNRTVKKPEHRITGARDRKIL